MVAQRGEQALKDAPLGFHRRGPRFFDPEMDHDIGHAKHRSDAKNQGETKGAGFVGPRDAELVQGEPGNPHPE